MRGTLSERLMSRVVVEPDGCWIWQGSQRADGYGQIWTSLDERGRRSLLSTHRASWELARGPVPEGLDLDHLCHDPLVCTDSPCRHRLCVNPEHLTPATRAANVLRGGGPAARNARQTNCRDCGSLLVPIPQSWGRGRRHCPTCRPTKRGKVSLTCGVCSGSFVATKSTATCCSNRCRRRRRLAAAS